MSDTDLSTLAQLVANGKESTRKLNRARALQFSQQDYKPQQISELLGISVPTVYNSRKRYREEGVEQALQERARPGQPRKVTPQVEAKIPLLLVVKLLMDP